MTLDYAMVVKLYGADPAAEKRYSPAKCIGARRQQVTGNPDPKHVSTSFAERQNLTMRDAHAAVYVAHECSKKVENHACAVALHAMYYNFVRIHQTLKVAPAMAAGITSRLWEIGDIVDVIEAWETSFNKRRGKAA